MHLDESLPIGALDDEDSEFLWDHWVREYPQDPWSAFSRLSDANVPPTLPACSRGQGKGLDGDSRDDA